MVKTSTTFRRRAIRHLTKPAPLSVASMIGSVYTKTNIPLLPQTEEQKKWKKLFDEEKQ